MSARLDARAPAEAGTVKANLVALGIAEGVARLAQLVTIALLGRVLGPEGVAVVGIGWAVNQLALPFVQYAPELMGARDVARGESMSTALIELTAVKLILAVIVSVVIVGTAAVLFAADPVTEIQVMAQGPLLVAIALNGVWAFRGLRRFGDYAVVRCLSSLLLLAMLAALLWVTPSPWTVPFAETGSGLLAATMAFGILLGWPSVPTALAKMLSSLRGARARIADAVQFGLGSFFAGAIWSTPLLVARVFIDPVEQGHLAACLRLMLAVNALFQLALQVFHPVLAHRYSTDRDAGRVLTGILVVYALAVSVPATAALILAAPFIIEPMLGLGFVGAVPMFQVLSSALVPSIVGSVFGYALLADGRYRLYNLFCAAGAVLSVIGCALGFRYLPAAEAVGAVTLTVTLIGVAAGVAAWWLDLVHVASVSWRQLTPARIGKVMRER